MSNLVKGGDRFIPMRMEMDVEMSSDDTCNPENIDLSLNGGMNVFVNLAKKRQLNENYRTLLRQTLLPMDNRVLNFFPPHPFIPKNPTPSFLEQNWPIKPKNKRPIIERPFKHVDINNIDTNIHHNVMDWSSKNYLATVCNGEVHMWNTDTNSVLQTHTKNVYNCIKWHPRGTKIALGLLPNHVGVFDIKTNKIFSKICCQRKVECLCSLEWVGDVLLTGCKHGVIKKLNRDLRIIGRVKKVNLGTIIRICSSCRGEFFATSGLNKVITIWSMDLSIQFEIKVSNVTTALAWHPWKEALLATGTGQAKGRVIIWNVRLKKRIDEETTYYINSSIISLTFNPVSAELVVNTVGFDDTNTMITSIITVLPKLNEIVEELYIHTGAVPYLLWSNDGRTLGSTDHNIYLWDFFGKVEKNNNENKKTTSLFDVLI